jgi:hypothetical protein
VNFDKLRDSIAKNPRVLLGMTDEMALAAAHDLIEELDERYEKDPWAWASEVVFTQDESAGTATKFPVDREYVRDLFDIFQNEQLIAIVKSRRVFATWAVAVYLTHRARYRPHQALFIQSETEDKSAFVVDRRINFIEDHLPLALRRGYKAVRTIKGAVGQLTYDGSRSFVKALAQGKDALRAFTPSVLAMDEVEFMSEGRQSLTAALPFAEKNAQVILISTSNGASGPLADIARSCGFVKYSAP